ncbi:MAG: hypothetical protein J0H01_33035 [Rhizobiales bacterium]|nr:hypothetical protein [Hyphomicrobiales bacterium]
MRKLGSHLGIVFGSLALALAAASAVAPARAAEAPRERAALAPVSAPAGTASPGLPVEMRGHRGGGHRGGFHRGGGFRHGGFHRGGFHRGGFGGHRHFGGGWGHRRHFGGGWGGPGWHGPRWHRPGWGYRRPWGPAFVGAPIGGWGGPACRRVLRVNAWGEPVWVTRCCRVVVTYDGFRQRVCRRVW